MAAQHRGQVGIHHRGLAPRHQPDQRRDLVRQRDLLESHLPRDLAHDPLVVSRAPGMHERHRQRPRPPVPGRLQGGAHRRAVRRAHHAALRVQPLVDLHHLLVELRRLLDLQCEDVGPGLAADLQHVAQTARDRQHRGRAGPLQKRVGRHRGAHLDAGDPVAGDLARNPQRVADPLQGGVVIGLPVLRQELGGGEPPRRVDRHHVGEGAAPVDPEPPAPPVRVGVVRVGVRALARAVHPPLPVARAARGAAYAARGAGQCGGAARLTPPGPAPAPASPRTGAPGAARRPSPRGSRPPCRRRPP